MAVQRYALVRDSDSVCENIILWDAASAEPKDQWTCPAGYHTVQSDTIQIGDTV